MSDPLRELRLVGSPCTPQQRAIAAVLAAGTGAALSHTAAAAWWGIPGFDLEPIHVTVPRRVRGMVLGTVHLTSMWPDHHRTEHRGVPITTPARTLVDLAPSIHPKRLERALDTAWANRLVSGLMVATVVEDLSARGRTGLAVVRGLLEARGPDWKPPASRLEARFADLVASAGDPPFERHVVLADATGVIGEVDLIDRAAGLVVEIDSTRFHSAPLDVAHDAERDRRLGAIGVRVHRVREDDLLKRPLVVLQELRAKRWPKRHPEARMGA